MVVLGGGGGSYERGTPAHAGGGWVAAKPSTSRAGGSHRSPRHEAEHARLPRGEAEHARLPGVSGAQDGCRLDLASFFSSSSLLSVQVLEGP